MRNKGLLSVFHKHLEKEVLNTPEFLRIIERFNGLSEMFFLKEVIRPVFIQFFKKTKDITQKTIITLSAADLLIEKSSKNCATVLNHFFSLSILLSKDLIYTALIRTGRIFSNGMPYHSEIDIRKNIRVLKNTPQTQHEIKEFLTAAIESVRYDDILEHYAPYTWRTMKVNYSVGELLNIDSITHKNNKISFDLSLYNEAADKIVEKHSIWHIKGEKGQNPTVHKIEVSDIL